MRARLIYVDPKGNTIEQALTLDVLPSVDDCIWAANDEIDTPLRIERIGWDSDSPVLGRSIHYIPHIFAKVEE